LHNTRLKKRLSFSRRIWGGGFGWLAVALLFPASSFAQALRLGPLDIDAKARTEAVYTTNVEQERESEATADREDVYFVVGLDLIGTALVQPRTELKLETGIAIEKHLNRDDLDNSENPFGSFRAASKTEIGRATVINAEAHYEKTAESEDDSYDLPSRTRATPDGGTETVSINRKKRKVHDAFGYSADGAWNWKRLSLNGGYQVESERYEEEEDQVDDQDESTLTFGAILELTSILSLTYDYENTKTETPNVEDDWEGWEETQTVGLDLTVYESDLATFTYTLALEKEDQQDEEGDWEPLHGFSLNGDILDRPRFNLSYSMSYDYEEDPEEDDIGFTYDVRASHQITESIKHSLSLTREPYDTLGSTEDTDNTTYAYDLIFSDLFIKNLELGISASYEIDEPMGPDAGDTETERTTIYGLRLAHSRQVTERIEQRLAYTYDLEDSNLEEELLEEHRIVLTYEYTF